MRISTPFLFSFKAPLAVLAWIMLNLLALAQSIPIVSVSFEGNKSIDANQLKSLLRLSSEGNLYVSENLRADLQAVERLYQDQGFLRARVGPPDVNLQVLGDKKVAVIRIPVSEGALYTVGEILVKNTQAFRPETLIQMCPLRKGESYSRRRVAQWQEKIEEAYHALGYIRFESAVSEDLHDLRKLVDCTLDCKEGKAYSVGKITIAGDPSINQLDFKRHLLLGEGGLYNPQTISLSIQFLNQMRIYRPISDADVEITADDASGTVNIVFHLVLLKKSTT